MLFHFLFVTSVNNKNTHDTFSVIYCNGVIHLVSRYLKTNFPTNSLPLALTRTGLEYPPFPYVISSIWYPCINLVFVLKLPHIVWPENFVRITLVYSFFASDSHHFQCDISYSSWWPTAKGVFAKNCQLFYLS